jgi:hypothetical protein
MTPRDPDKGNFDDTEFPGDNPDVPGSADDEERDPKHSDRKLRGGDAGDEGDYDDKDQ